MKTILKFTLLFSILVSATACGTSNTPEEVAIEYAKLALFDPEACVKKLYNIESLSKEEQQNAIDKLAIIDKKNLQYMTFTVLSLDYSEDLQFATVTLEVTHSLVDFKQILPIKLINDNGVWKTMIQ